jgi:uncharacterized membrane protein YgcG
MMPILITTTLFGMGILALPAMAVAQAPQYGTQQNQMYNAPQGPPYGANQAPAPGGDQGHPGIVNYVEGAVFVKGRQIGHRDVGVAGIDRGEVLSTETGKEEMLLTPGVFLRLDDHSEVKMISPDLTKTQVELVKGRAAVEVDEIYPQNDLEILDAGVVTQLVKPGFYEFNTNPSIALVFVGKAAVEVGPGKYKEVKNHHEFALAEGVGAQQKPADFDTRRAQDEFYNWSILRSQYLAEANNQIAGGYAGVAGFAPGWYWDPYMWDYTFIGMGPYWSPFGFGFFPPWGWYGGYWHGGYWGGRYYGRGGYGGGYHGEGDFHGGGYSGGGFHGGGGFSGGGGGGHR